MRLVKRVVLGFFIWIARISTVPGSRALDIFSNIVLRKENIVLTKAIRNIDLVHFFLCVFISEYLFISLTGNSVNTSASGSHAWSIRTIYRL